MGGSAVDDYFAYLTEKAQSMQGLFDWLAGNDLEDAGTHATRVPNVTATTSPDPS